VNGPSEEALSGGYSTPVVRMGDTVRRAAGPWSRRTLSPRLPPGDACPANMGRMSKGEA
jgi:hypothetical protein